MTAAASLRLALLSDAPPSADADEEGPRYYLCFDPNALGPLTREGESADAAAYTLFHDEGEVIRAMLLKWTAMSARFSLIDISTVLRKLLDGAPDEWSKEFLLDIKHWGAELGIGVSPAEPDTTESSNLVALRTAIGEAVLSLAKRRATLVPMAERSLAETLRLKNLTVLTEGGDDGAIALRFPGQHRIPIENSFSPDPEESPALAIRRHAVAVADELRARGVPFSIMYVASDQLLFDALNEEPTLWNELAHRGVVIASPLAFNQIVNAATIRWDGYYQQEPETAEAEWAALRKGSHDTERKWWWPL